MGLLHIPRSSLLAFPITLLATLNVRSAQAQPCDCPAEFDWMVGTFSENDAGYGSVVERSGPEDLERHTATLRTKALGMSSVPDCLPVLDEWLMYFRHGHIGVWAKKKGPIPPRPETEPLPPPPPPVDITEASLIKRLSAKGYDAHPMEGIWSGGTTRLAIVRAKKRNGLDVVVLRSNDEHWKPKDVRATLDFAPNNDTLNGTIYVTQTWWDEFVTARYPMPVTANLVGGSEGALLDLFGLWKREYPPTRLSPLDSIRFALNSGSDLFALALGERTMYLRIPSFAMDAKAAIDSMLAANDKAIRSLPNLIIDIRNGTGGGDAAYAGLMPYLYTAPIRGMGIAVRATPLNADAYAGYARFYPNDTASANDLVRFADRLRQHPGTFVPRDGQGRRVQVDSSFTPSAMPQRVAILCNGGNGSTDEQFLLEARTSWKVKLFGRPTRGAIDVSNLNEVDSPSGLFALAYAMSRSYRTPDLIIDDRGIQPDHFLDDGIPEDEWVRYVQGMLER
ncbi:MAG TPA: S41 family peptidase [Flavobacteriales bacterium]